MGVHGDFIHLDKNLESVTLNDINFSDPLTFFAKF